MLFLVLSYGNCFNFDGCPYLPFDWLELAYDNRDGGLTYLLHSFRFAKLHEDPRWTALLDKMGLPH